MAPARARFDDLVAGRALVFDQPSQIVLAHEVDEVRDVLAEVERLTGAGRWAYGFLTYEAAAGLDASLRTRPGHADGLPPAWFAVTQAPRTEPATTAPTGQRAYWTSPWRLDCSPAEHAASVERIRREIAAGDYYQANLTARLHGAVLGDPLEFYRDLVHAQRGAHNAFLDTGAHAVVSASPELFVEWTSTGLRCRPMKGTAPRGADAAEDGANRERLRHSAKDAAENVMIVDLLRNDLGHIAETGSVRVRSLFDVERYESVWQLTSEIVATPRDDASLLDVVTALFPCGSVTGAPKAAAMAAISEIESTPRGLYCGAIGWVAPPGEPTRAQFNVAIRTAVIEHEAGTARYGAGGGITIGSDPAAEFRELLDKAAVLHRAVADVPPLTLLETFGYEPGIGLRNLARHLARLEASGRVFGIAVDLDAIGERLALDVPTDQGPQRVSLRLGDSGLVEVETAAFEANGSLAPLRLVVDDRPVDSASLWLRHKTNRRGVYDSARARHPGADDVVLVNERGELTETTIANVAVRLDGQWFTPPLDSGCLPGVGRALACESGELTPQTLPVAVLAGAEAVATISSLRGWRRAVVGGPGVPSPADGTKRP